MVTEMGDDKNSVLRRSDAWNANKAAIPLPPTEYPEISRKLLESVDGFFGLKERLSQFFEEYYHPFPNAKTVATGFRTLALQDIWAFHKTQEPAKNIFSIAILGIEALKNSWPFHEKERILTALFGLFEKELESTFLEDKDCVILLNKLIPIIKMDDLFFARASTRIKKLYLKVKEGESLNVLRLLTIDSLTACYKMWGSTTSSDWLEKYSDLKLLRIPVGFIGEIDAYLESLNPHMNVEEIRPLPDYESLSRTLLNSVRGDLPIIEKSALLLSLFELKPMAFYQKEMLSHLTLILRKAPLANDSQCAIDIFTMLFPFLRIIGDEHFVVTNSILLHLGKQIIPEGQVEIVEMFCKNILTIPFPDPRISGVNKDWQIIRNPAHLPTIRTYLEIIRVAPEKTSLLLAGLHINLREGDVFISDTDLFQSDVSKLLNSEIQPVYKQVKQLCRLFPVFFREIGAEGELRTSSTLIDEHHHRKDRLIHFFRKQIHIESNNALIDLVAMVLQTWIDDDISRLKDVVPRDVWEFLQRDDEYIKEAHETVTVLIGALGLKNPMELMEQDFETVMSYCVDGNLDIRVAHLIQIHRLLVAKYDLDAVGARDALLSVRFIKNEDVNILFKYIDNLEFEKAIDQSLELIAGLKDIILDPEISKGEERIYRKRHIAVGIPSMYGSYQEKKLECLGATYRLERLITLLVDNMISMIDLDYITRPALRKIHWILKRLIRALELDGIRVHEIKSNLRILEAAVKREGFSLSQFLNIFQVISQRARSIIDRYFYGFHKTALSIIGDVRFETEDEKEKLSERVMRGILSAAFGVGQVDSFMTTIISTLGDMRLKLNPEILDLILSYDADRSMVRIHDVPKDMANAIWLGNKGYNLHLLNGFGVKVPWGFVLTTEVYRCRKALDSYPQMKVALRRRLISEIQTLEGLSGLMLGKIRDGKPPLLLSIRSGAAVSMPGVMTTFLNIGLNYKVVEELSRLPNYGWTAWDCYRRMIQIWGMSNGIDRDEFDGIMHRCKARYEVDRKLELSPANMAKVTGEYLNLIHKHNIFIPEDPFEQIIEAMELVFQSWDSLRARIYREQFDLAEEWGTAVLVQRMILGNINYDSGTGVAMTKSRGRNIKIYGDYVPHSQGEDVVSGLVHPFPIAEEGRRGEDPSLEESYPQHFKTLLELGKKLVIENDFADQEIEFTFEDSTDENLYILQCRTLISGHSQEIPVFKEDEFSHPTSMGVGTGGGAYVGRAVFDREGILELGDNNKVPLLLIRPDTVPDDVDMIFKCGGLLTARGGITSHAAVTANRLGKVCVVNCKDLIVRDYLKEAALGDEVVIKEGDWVSIDGRTGLIFFGKREVMQSSDSAPVVDMV
jgi:pyruvate, orthophosphate dikinase